MSQDGLVSHELVSALADGQLGGDEFAGVLVSLAKSDEAVAAWHAYHIVGDVLRCAELGDGRDDLAFVARLRGQLSSLVGTPNSAPSPIENGVISVGASSEVVVAGPDGLRNESANDPVTRWKLLAGITSMVAVAAVGWQLASGDARLGGAAQLSAVPGVSISAAAVQAGMTEPAIMLRDARLDELLAAHKQFGGTSALQMPAGFLRNATFDNPGR